MAALNKTRNSLIAKASEKEEAAKTIGWKSRELTTAGLTVPRAMTLARVESRYVDTTHGNLSDPLTPDPLRLHDSVKGTQSTLRALGFRKRNPLLKPLDPAAPAKSLAFIRGWGK